jgi:4-amino-4-deoxy-L-arabinose transferase-like glycosyltransferase
VPAPSLPVAESQPVDARVALVIGLGLVARLALAPLVPLTPDEAYYADWARHLAPGYLDHPPLVAWLIAASTAALRRSELAVRLPAILLQAATTWLGASLARARGGPRAGLAASLLFQAAPVFSLGAVLMTPDAPLAFAWAGALWALERALRGDRRLFLAAGVFLGLAALSKLSAGLLVMAMLGALLADRDGRRALAGPWPWLGACLALAVASPMLLWNARNGWPSFAFQVGHGLSGRSFSLLRLAGSLGAQAGYVSPVIAGLAAVAAWRALRRGGDPARRALAFSALPVVALFTAAAAFTPGSLPHWPAPGWLSAALLLAIEAPRRLRAAMAPGFALSALVIAALLLPLPLPGNPLDELRGWREGARAARAAARGERLAATHWIVLGQLSWYTGEEVAYLGERPCAASYYAPDPLRAGSPLLVVVAGGLGPDLGALQARLGPLEPAGDAPGPVRHYRFFRLPPRR